MKRHDSEHGFHAHEPPVHDKVVSSVLHGGGMNRASEKAVVEDVLAVA